LNSAAMPIIPGSYWWSKNPEAEDEVLVFMRVVEGIKAADVDFLLKGKKFRLGLKGAETVIDDELTHAVDVEASTWELRTIRHHQGDVRCVVVTLVKKNEKDPWEFLVKAEDAPADTTITERVFFDVSVDSAAVGRVQMGLYGKQVPRTVHNFRALCTGEAGTGKGGVPLTFEGNVLHRIIPRFMIQGGDITKGDGTGGLSVFGDWFHDENFKVKHTKPGLLSMANSGPDTNGSQFFITLKESPHLDGKHVVFGEVLSGMEVVERIEAVGSASGQPSKKVEITACGVCE